MEKRRFHHMTPYEPSSLRAYCGAWKQQTDNTGDRPSCVRGCDLPDWAHKHVECRECRLWMCAVGSLQTAEEAEQWVRGMVRAGLAWHWDDDPSDCLRLDERKHEYLVERLRKRVADIFRLLEDPFQPLVEEHNEEFDNRRQPERLAIAGCTSATTGELY